MWNGIDEQGATHYPRTTMVVLRSLHHFVDIIYTALCVLSWFHKTRTARSQAFSSLDVVLAIAASQAAYLIRLRHG